MSRQTVTDCCNQFVVSRLVKMLTFIIYPLRRKMSLAEADLIKAFVPVAVDEADGVAGSWETATKTNSLIDRLRSMTLPVIEDVRESLASYQETMARAEELEAKIEPIGELINKIVYELYGLTDEEIEIVEKAST